MTGNKMKKIRKKSGSNLSMPHNRYTTDQRLLTENNELSDYKQEN